MSVRWSSENVVAEHRELQATTMALDCCGEYAILAGRRYLALLSLDRPTEIIKRINRTQQKYDILVCEWHPAQSERNTFAVANGDRAEVCIWDEGHLKTQHVLRSHTRTVTDINWHHMDPNVLATCSIDTFVYIWDVREARKPITYLSAIAGASQVKWNKLNSHLIASAHDSDIRVWDDRKTNQPIQYISAHLSKIHGLDWSPNYEHHLVSASNDCTVKFFDITSPRKEENFINTLSPVWRAKYTPFGEGVVTVVMPQLRRGENSLLLWSVNDVGEPAHTFVGHNDVVLKFEWRQSITNPGDVQMVSWARDNSLRIWNIDHQLQRMCGHDAEEDNMLIESTDSELTSEPALIPDSEVEMDKVDSSVDSPISIEGGSPKLLNDGTIPEQPENIQEGSPEGQTEISAAATSETEVARSTPVSTMTDVPQVVHQESDGTVQLDRTPESTLASTPTSSQMIENLPSASTPSKSSSMSVGMSSTLPSMNHPMTLHQEFSLLNTHLDNNQGNSLDVSAGGMEMLTEIGSRAFNQGVPNFDQGASSYGHDEKTYNQDGSNYGRGTSNYGQDASGVDGHLNDIACQDNDLKVGGADLDESDGNDLVTAVRKLARELESKPGNECGDVAVFSCSESSLVGGAVSTHSSEKDNCDTTSNIFQKGSLKEIMQTADNLVTSYTPNDIKTQIVQEDKSKPIVISYSSSGTNSCDNVLAKAVVESRSDCILDIDPATVSSNENLITNCEQNVQPLKILFKSQDSTDFHPHQIPGNLMPYSFSSDRSSFSREKVGENYHPEMLAQVLSSKELTPAGSADVVENVKEETVIYVVENESSKHLLQDTNTNYCNSDPSPPDSSHLMLSLSLPLVDVNVAVMDGSIIVKSSSDSSVQVPAKLVYFPDPENLKATEEVCAMLAPQLLEGGVLVQGNNIMILKNQSFLITVNSLLWEGDKQHTQLSISSPTESMEAYQARGTNFVMITGTSENSLGILSQTMDGVSVKNAPSTDEQCIFQCDKCDKSYKARSSLNSHKVTHSMEKMYKCDECDKAFHYSTPLQIHKRTHSDERPYHCQYCSASFRSKANLKIHERLHTGERPVICRYCNQRFKDYTSLKRHKTKVHELVIMKCDECGEVCSSLETLTTHMWETHNVLYVDKVIYKCEKCGETFGQQKCYNNHMADHRRTEKNSQGSFSKLSDYNYRCGVCSMTCNNKSQMILHIQIHAAHKKYICRYCKTAHMYHSLLVNHVREEHPDEPEWFCQHCDSVFKSGRELNVHSCRSVRGNYSCPHCDFKTEIRHRLFRHIVKCHPYDKTPYYCEFCKSSFEDPNRLRYHQKREHPEEMLTLSMQRETLKHPSSLADKSDNPTLDMSQIEMSIEGSTIVYYIPEHLRNDEVFKQKVKFKCYYCEAKFPVKNAMTRHILKEHPSEKAYKCIDCDIFFKTTIESKNHNRKYHRYGETNGRDPSRNEKAMKKRAQWFKEQFEKSDSKVKNMYKFKCRFCDMAYRCKRHIIFHYKKWHPDEEWDYFPDKPYQNIVAKKERRLVFYHCTFDDGCKVVFDDKALLIEHILNAHGIPIDEGAKYVETKVVVDKVHRGRIPRNAVNLGRESGVLSCKRESEDEFDVDDPSPIGNELEKFEEKTHLKDLDELKGPSGKASSLMLKSKRKPSRISPKLENITSIKDVKKLLYRCRKCSLYFPDKAKYKEHNYRYRDVDCRDFLHLNVKQESEEELSDGDDSINFKASEELSLRKSHCDSRECDNLKSDIEMAGIKVELLNVNNSVNFKTSKKLRLRKGDDLKSDIEIAEMKEFLVGERSKMNESFPEGITITVLEELCEDAKILFVNEYNKETILDRGENQRKSELDVAYSNEFFIQSSEYNETVDIHKYEQSSECLKINSQSNLKQTVLKQSRKSVQESDSKVKGTSTSSPRKPVPREMQCDICFISFKTRAERSFHMRYDH